MSYPPIRVLRPGAIDFNAAGQGRFIRLQNWVLDMGGREGPPQDWSKDIMSAVRLFSNERFRIVMREPSPTQPEAPDKPISLAVESAAEVEVSDLMFKFRKGKQT